MIKVDEVKTGTTFSFFSLTHLFLLTFSMSSPSLAPLSFSFPITQARGSGRRLVLSDNDFAALCVLNSAKISSTLDFTA